MNDQPIISGQAVNALAFLMHQVRPEWDGPGCVAALRKLGHLPLPQLVIAAMRAAMDPINETPASFTHLENRAWDSDFHPPCRVHPKQRARRTDGECASCYADRKAATEPEPMDRRGVAPSGEARALIDAALHRRKDTP